MPESAFHELSTAASNFQSTQEFLVTLNTSKSLEGHRLLHRVLAKFWDLGPWNSN